MKQNTHTTEQVNPLALEFPAEFDVKPVHVVKLPGNCTAQLFSTTVQAREYDDEGKQVFKNTPAWRIIIVNKNGRTPRALSTNNYRTGNSEATLTDKLDIRRFIETAAWALSKVKVTTVTELDGEE